MSAFKILRSLVFISLCGAASGEVPHDILRSRCAQAFDVEAAEGYHCWPMIQSVGSRLICLYTSGTRHNAGEKGRGTYARHSDDGGKTWSERVTVAEDPLSGETPIAKGLDEDGRAIFGIRRYGPKPRFAFYRTLDGETFEEICAWTPRPVPVQITDFFHVPGVGLMAFWFGGNYGGDDGSRCWGVMRSADNGKTWRQSVCQSNLRREDWPTEPSAAYLGDGRILAIGRSESGCGSLFQLVSTDYGETWQVQRTNIADVEASTPSVIYDAENDKLTLYYYQRKVGALRRRVAVARDVFAQPLAWPESEVVHWGSRASNDAGNVNAVATPTHHVVAFYSGKRPNCAVKVLALPVAEPSPAKIPQVSVRPCVGARIPVRRSIIGVNHLAYGKNGLGYGMILPNSHALDPDLVAMQKEIGFGSLRYPGGCGGTHNFQWKVNAGLEGNYSVMGLVEFLSMSESCGAEPILGISAQRGSPAEAAEYVQFLNAPADAAHPWALRRAERGHAEPYGIKWFEYGNESYHGHHAPRSITGEKGGLLGDIDPQDYCDSYLAFRKAMQAEDASVCLGACLEGGGALWDKVVVSRLGKIADFFVIHTYAPVPERDADDYLTVFTDRSAYLKERLEETKRQLGRNGPFAITEFNARQTQHKTLTAGLVNLQTLMDFAEDSSIVHTDFWQFINEGFGMVYGSQGAFVKRPNAWAFQLYSRYTLDNIVPTKAQVVACDDQRHDASEEESVPAAWRGRNAMDGVSFRYREGGSAASTGTRYELLPDGTHKLTFLDGRKQNFYQLSALMKGLPPGDGCVWKISYEMWVVGNPDPFAMHLEIVDGRGWGATKSAQAADAVSGVDPIRITTTYRPLKDNPGSLLLRFRGAGKGTVYVRDIRVEAVAKTRSKESAVRAQLSVSTDSRHAAVIFINRSLTEQSVTFEMNGFGGGDPIISQAEVLSGPAPYATNEDDPHAVTIRPFPISRTDRGTLRFVMPPHSAVGVRLDSNGRWKERH